MAADSYLDQIIKALEAVKTETKRRGLGLGKGGHGSMTCPMPNCQGNVTFIVSGTIGHLTARCSKYGCLNARE